MRRHRLLCALLVVGACGISTAATGNAPEPQDSHWIRLDAANLPTEWEELRKRVQDRRWVRAEITERRKFSFRREAVELEGVVWFGRDEGLTLFYQMPREEIVRIDKGGMRVIRDQRHGRIRRPADQRIQEVPDALLALFRFDLAELGTTFKIRGRHEADRWFLNLSPRDNDHAGLAAVEIEGTGDDISRVVIDQVRDRQIELSFANTTYPESLDTEERNRLFP